MGNRRRLAEEYAVKILYKILKNPKNKRILDIGCGQKVQSHPFVENNNEYYGVDLDVRKKRMYENEVLVRADAMHLPFRSRQFDIAFSRELLHHVEYPVEVIMEMDRVSNRIVLIEGNKYAPYLIGVYYSGHKHFSREDFKNVLREALKTEPNVQFTGIYPYNSNFSMSDAMRQVMMTTYQCYEKMRKKETRPRQAFLGIIFSPTIMLERFLYFLTTFSFDFFFSSRLFANSLLAFEMIFDSH